MFNIVKHAERRPPKYPYVAHHTNYETWVVLFFGPRHGVVLSSPTSFGSVGEMNYVGRVHDEFAEENFVPMSCTIEYTLD